MHFDSTIYSEVQDGVFEKAEISARKLSEEGPDDIENKTIKIFLDLLSLADQTERKEIEAVVTGTGHEISPISPESYQIKSTYRFRPFRRETHFSVNEYGQPFHAQEAMYNIVLALAEVFLGWNFVSKKSLGEIKKVILIDQQDWNNNLKKSYEKPVNDEMQKAFGQANELLESRKNIVKKACLQRVVFYALLVVAVVGKVFARKSIMVVGTLAASIMALFMGVHYGTSPFIVEQESCLKSTTGRAYQAATSAPRIF